MEGVQEEPAAASAQVVIGLSQRKSVEQSVSPCSTASAAR